MKYGFCHLITGFHNHRFEDILINNKSIQNNDEIVSILNLTQLE